VNATIEGSTGGSVEGRMTGRRPGLLGPIIEAQAPIAIADGRAAVKLLRSRAAEWNLDPQRIGMLGFSAGGGVATGTATQYEAGERPDFAALIYGAICRRPYGKPELELFQTSTRCVASANRA
jgi:hypothetical protein